MLKVGLTGSIAVGKSHVCDVLREFNIAVLDADQVSRDVVIPNSFGWHQIVENFGTEIINVDQTIDRAKLGRLVFENEAKRTILNSIVHPLVFEAQAKWLYNQELETPKGIAVIDAALMIESGNYRRFDKIVVVWCQPEIQIRRLMNRNGLSENDALRRISAQMSQETKKKYADYLIDSSGSLEETRVQIIEIYDRLQLLVK